MGPLVAEGPVCEALQRKGHYLRLCLLEDFSSPPTLQDLALYRLLRQDGFKTPLDEFLLRHNLRIQNFLHGGLLAHYKKDRGGIFVSNIYFNMVHGRMHVSTFLGKKSPQRLAKKKWPTRKIFLPSSTGFGKTSVVAVERIVVQAMKEGRPTNCELVLTVLSGIVLSPEYLGKIVLYHLLKGAFFPKLMEDGRQEKKYDITCEGHFALRMCKHFNRLFCSTAEIPMHQFPVLFCLETRLLNIRKVAKKIAEKAEEELMDLRHNVAKYMESLRRGKGETGNFVYHSSQCACDPCQFLGAAVGIVA